MTREEAIEWMEVKRSTVIEVPDRPQGARELIQAYDMAIEALQAEPTCEHFYKGYCSRFEDGCFRQCQAEPVKHGKWINKRLTKDSIKDIKDGTYGELIGYHDICSVCGFDIDEFWCATGSPYYCPNCGAKMKGEQDD